jgi:hypothetical protein
VARISIKHYTLSFTPHFLFYFHLSFHKHKFSRISDFLCNDDAITGSRCNLHAYHRSTGVRRRSEIRGSFSSSSTTFTFFNFLICAILDTHSPISRSWIKIVATLLFLVSFVSRIDFSTLFSFHSPNNVELMGTFCVLLF